MPCRNTPSFHPLFWRLFLLVVQYRWAFLCSDSSLSDLQHLEEKLALVPSLVFNRVEPLSSLVDYISFCPLFSSRLTVMHVVVVFFGLFWEVEFAGILRARSYCILSTRWRLSQSFCSIFCAPFCFSPSSGTLTTRVLGCVMLSLRLDKHFPAWVLCSPDYLHWSVFFKTLLNIFLYSSVKLILYIFLVSHCNFQF